MLGLGRDKGSFEEGTLSAGVLRAILRSSAGDGSNGHRLHRGLGPGSCGRRATEMDGGMTPVPQDGRHEAAVRGKIQRG